MGHEYHGNTSGNRSSWSDQDQRVKNQQVTVISKVCPPQNCSHPKEEFHQVQVQVFLFALILLQYNNNKEK